LKKLELLKKMLAVKEKKLKLLNEQNKRLRLKLKRSV